MLIKSLTHTQSSSNSVWVPLHPLPLVRLHYGLASALKCVGLSHLFSSNGRVTSLCFDKQADTRVDCHRLCLRLNACQILLPHASEKNTKMIKKNKRPVKRRRRPSRRNLTAARRRLCGSCAARVFHTEAAVKEEVLSFCSHCNPGHVVRYTHTLARASILSVLLHHKKKPLVKKTSIQVV